jgi:hypothetical protein
MTAKLASVPISRYRKMNGVEFAGIIQVMGPICSSFRVWRIPSENLTKRGIRQRVYAEGDLMAKITAELN